MAVDHQSIRKIVGEEEAPSDTSLRAQSLHRALQQKVPKTLTPYEWEQWYAEHGVPDGHKTDESGTARRWWRQFWKGSRSRASCRAP